MLWSLGTLRQTGEIPSPRLPFTRASYSPDGRYLALANDDGDVWLSTEDSIQLRRLPVSYVTWGIVFSPDSRRLISVGGDRAARVWDTATLAPLLTLRHPNRVLGVALSRDGTALATGGIAGNIHLWDVSGSAPVQLSSMAGQHTGEVTQAAVGAAILATVAYDREVILWNIVNPASPRFLSKIPLVAEEITRAALRPDGKILVTGTNNNGAIFWDLRDPAAPRELTASTTTSATPTPSTSLPTAPDSSPATPTTASSSGTSRSPPARVAWTSTWTTQKPWPRSVSRTTATPSSAPATTGLSASGAPAIRLTGHTQAVVGADVSSDGKRLLTSASDGTARIWDLTTDHPSTLAVLSAADGSVGYGFFLADNRTVVTVNNGRTRLWDTDATAVATRICALAGHDITADEWRQHFDDLVPHRPPCAR